MSKKAFITGVASGIGYQIAREYVELGCEVHGTIRCADAIQTSIEKFNGIELYETGDVQSVESFFFDRFAHDDFDILVNNVGMNSVNLISHIDNQTLRDILDVNFTFAFMAIRDLNIVEGGKIVNISSISGLSTKPGRLAYSASKHAMNALTATAALELAERNILVNSVCPGPIDTKMTQNSPTPTEDFVDKIPLKRLGTTQEVADLVLFLTSDKNSYITGQNIVIDGGLTVGW